MSMMRYAWRIMYTRRYFIAALGLPLLVVLMAVAYVVFFTKPSAGNISVLVTPYACFFLVLSIWSFNQTPSRIRRVAYRAPLIFLVFQLAYLVLEYTAGVSLARNLMGLTGVLVIVATYIIIVGYLYAFIMEQGYFSYLNHKRHQPAPNNTMRC